MKDTKNSQASSYPSNPKGVWGGKEAQEAQVGVNGRQQLGRIDKALSELLSIKRCDSEDHVVEFSLLGRVPVL